MSKQKEILPHDAVILTQEDVIRQLAPVKGKKDVFIVPEGVSVIGERAFFNCGEIRRIILPDSLVMIRESAFLGCEKLETINLPENLAAIGESSFYRCIKLRSISLPEKIKIIPNNAFHFCTSLTDVHLPSGLTRICFEAFSDCISLVEISLPESLRVIEEQAFMCCSKLERLVLPKGVSTIHKNAFLKCDRLELETESSDTDTFAQKYIEDWRKKVQEEKNTVILCCEGCGEPCAAFPAHGEDELSWSKLRAQGGMQLKEKPLPGQTITTTVYYPFFCKIGDRFSASYGEGEFLTAILTGIVSSEKSEAVIRAKVLETGNRLSFMRLLSAAEIEELETSREYNYTPPGGDYDNLNLKIRQLSDQLISLYNDYGGGDLSTTHYLYTDEDGVDHLVELWHSDFHSNYTTYGDMVLGLHRYRPFQWENGFLINRNEKAVWKGSEDLIDAVVPDYIEHIGIWAFNDCVNLRTITLPASVHYIDYLSIYECKKLKQIRIHASVASFNEDNLRILLPNVELVYLEDGK